MNEEINFAIKCVKLFSKYSLSTYVRVLRNFQREHRRTIRPTPPPTTTAPTTRTGDEDDNADTDSNDNEVQNTAWLINWSPSGYGGKKWMRKSTLRLDV